MNTHLISIVIPNWNGRRFLKGCLDSLKDQTFKNFEIIMVDNNSGDGSVYFVKENYPDVRTIDLSSNRGFAGGVNEGIRAAKGGLIFLLNNDTIVDTNCLQVLHKSAMENTSIGFFATKMLFYNTVPPVINAAGDAVGIDGSAKNIGYKDVDNGQYDAEREVFGACAGAALYRRGLFDKIGLFDEDFYLILEDVDIDFRAQLAGYRCLYVPGAVVYHIHAGSIGKMSNSAFYWTTRNDLNVLIKNMPLSLLLKYLHRILLRQTRYTYSCLLHNKIRPLITGELNALLLLPTMLAKRHQILNNKKVSARYIDKVLFHDSGAISLNEIKRLKNKRPDVPVLNYFLSFPLFLITEFVFIPFFFISISGCAVVDIFYFVKNLFFAK
ncbi:MAG: glycosyltransferase [Nitrospirae bacterium]|nr:glycosyltransferase [Nitrospirota bacterium]